MKTHLKTFNAYIKSNFIFYYPSINNKGDDLYFCTCGNKLLASPDQASFALKFEDINKIDLDNIHTAYIRPDVKCNKCERDFSLQENYSRIQPLETEFIDRFQVIQDDKMFALVKMRGYTEFNKEKQTMSVKSIESYITVDRKSKKIKYKSLTNDKAITIQLQNVIESSREFFTNSKETILNEGFINIHDFISKMANMVVDSKNMNIIEELMSMMIGQSGINVLHRTIAIFMSIMCYPYLTTIALSKGNVFLYDLLSKCSLPDNAYLESHKATSPLKIFNTLVEIKNTELQKELDSDDKSKLGYIYKSNGKELTIKYDKNFLSDTNVGERIVAPSGANVFVRDEITNQKLSPYIFNKLTKFSDYENIIQWMKFISYNDVIKLVMDYDLELLNIIYKKIEFRDDINLERIKQFIPLMLSYAEIELTKENSVIKYKVIPKKTVNSKYEAIKYFDFNLYDDCMRMLLELNWTPNKILHKTKDFNKLVTLHHNLLKFRSYISDADVNDRYTVFSDKYRYLEGDAVHPDGDYSFNLKLLATPSSLLNTAIEMHNCAGSYINKVANGTYIPFVICDNFSGRTQEEFFKYMIIFEVTKLGLELVGVKSYCNEYGSDRFKEQIIKYLIEHDISFRDVPSIKRGIKSKELSYIGTFDKVETPNNNIKGELKKE